MTYKRGNSKGADRYRPTGQQCTTCNRPLVGPVPQACACTHYGATEPEAIALLEAYDVEEAGHDRFCGEVELLPVYTYGRITLRVPADMPLTEALWRADILYARPSYSRPPSGLWMRSDIVAAEKQDGDFCTLSLVSSRSA